MREEHETKNITPGRDERGSDHRPFRIRFWNWIKEKSSFTDWCLVIFTGVLSVASTYQFILLGGQLNIMQNDERAWIQVGSQPDAQGSDTTTLHFSAGQQVTYPLRVKNIGKTAASNVRMKIFVDIIDASHEVPLNRVNDESYPRNNITSGIIFPGSDFRDFVVRVGENGTVLPATSAEVSEIKNGKAYWAVYGLVTYDDLFRGHHWTKFCMWGAESGTFFTRTCTEYNSVGDY